jgi:hypothetical protein
MSDFVGSELKTPLYEMMHSLCHKLDKNKLEEILNKPIDQVLCACNPEGFNNRLWLLKGSPLLSEFEAELTRAIGPPDETPNQTHRHYIYTHISASFLSSSTSSWIIEFRNRLTRDCLLRGDFYDS